MKAEYHRQRDDEGSQLRQANVRASNGQVTTAVLRGYGANVAGEELQRDIFQDQSDSHGDEEP
jgi:hypothetical protein